jgi:hypothetical protein
MSTTATEGYVFTVGQILSDEDFPHLPVGATIRNQQTSQVFEVVRFHGVTGNRNTVTTRVSAWDSRSAVYCTYSVASLPEVAPVLPTFDSIEDEDEDDGVEKEDCSSCGDSTPVDDMTGTSDGDVCETCVDDYYQCVNCEDLFTSLNSTLSDDEACDRCLRLHWTYCNDCDGYYPDGYEDDHEHEDGCDCEAPGRGFMVRNDGDPLLANDTPATVSLPAGVISAEGLTGIFNYLRDYARGIEDAEERLNMRALASMVSVGELGDKWQTKEGNFTKRLSRYAYKTYGLKVPAHVISGVGCIARDHSTSVDFEVEVTRELNQSPEEFAHEDSCWWQSYYEGRCALKNNGGFGLRTFKDNHYGHRYASGRAWVFPLKQDDQGLTPTFNTETPDAFVVFNGYGDLSGYAAPRLLSHMAGMTYRRITFSCSVTDLDNEDMYVNGDSGYLIAPEEIARHYTDGSLSLSLQKHSNLYYNEREV